MTDALPADAGGAFGRQLTGSFERLCERILWLRVKSTGTWATTLGSQRVQRMSTVHDPASQLDSSRSPEWPAVIRTKVFYGREHGHWFALDADFDLASMGDSADEALASLSGMVTSYLESYVREGKSYAEALRPIPVSLRAKLHFRVLLSKPLRRVVTSATARESELLLPRGAIPTAHCC